MHMNIRFVGCNEYAQVFRKKMQSCKNAHLLKLKRASVNIHDAHDAMSLYNGHCAKWFALLLGDVSL